jgi:hypothetical protein
MQQFIYYYKYLYMFRASVCPSSGVLCFIGSILLHMVFSTVKGNGAFPFTVLNTICSSIQRIKRNIPEDGHTGARNM